MIFTDTHTHLYDEQFKEDRDQTIKAAIEAGITKMYLPNCDSTTLEGMLELSKQHPENCFPMMGLHPCYVKADNTAELKLVADELATGKYYGVGEIGLDYYWDKTYTKQQIEAFEYQIDLALQHDLPIIIHSRDSLQDGIDIVRKKQNGRLKGIFHCFGGNEQEAQQIIDCGFYMGIGGVVTFKNSTLPQVLKNISLEHLVLETDAPYLAPTPFRGKRNESSYITLIAEKLAEIKERALEDVARITTDNATKVFGTNRTI